MLYTVPVAKEQYNKVQVQALNYGIRRGNLVYDW